MIVEEVFDSEAYNCCFDVVQAKFGTLCHDIFSIIATKVTLTDEFKKYLQRCFPCLIGELANVTTVDGLIDAVKRKCSIINVVPLETICKRYNLTEAMEMVEKYKNEILCVLF